MLKNSNPTWAYFKLVLFVVFLAELVLFLLGLIFGSILDHDLTMTAYFWLGINVAGCFALVVLGNVLLIGGSKLIGSSKIKLTSSGCGGGLPPAPTLPIVQRT
jgi:hypothetical protein